MTNRSGCFARFESCSAASPPRLQIRPASFSAAPCTATWYVPAARSIAPIRRPASQTRCALVGRVSMDLIAVDVTEVAGGYGYRSDFVTLVGGDIGVDELAAASGT